MTDSLIRRADVSDAETIAALGARTFTETFGHLYTPDDLAAFLRDGHSFDRALKDLNDPRKALWLVEADGEAIGYGLAGPCELPHPEASAEQGELKRIYMVQGRQGGGVGGRLLRLMLDWLERAYPGPLWIGVWSENHGAQRLYGRMGFEKVGEYGFVVGDHTDHEFILRRS